MLLAARSSGRTIFGAAGIPLKSCVTGYGPAQRVRSGSPHSGLPGRLQKLAWVARTGTFEQSTRLNRCTTFQKINRDHRFWIVNLNPSLEQHPAVGEH